MSERLKLKKIKPFVSKRISEASLVQENSAPVDMLGIEMRRAGYSEEDIKRDRKIEYILELGKENIIEPCNGCPAFNPTTLCENREDIRTSERGSLVSPRGQVITIQSK